MKTTLTTFHGRQHARRFKSVALLRGARKKLFRLFPKELTGKKCRRCRIDGREMNVKCKMKSVKWSWGRASVYIPKISLRAMKECAIIYQYWRKAGNALVLS